MFVLFEKKLYVIRMMQLKQAALWLSANNTAVISDKKRQSAICGVPISVRIL